MPRETKLDPKFLKLVRDRKPVSEILRRLAQERGHDFSRVGEGKAKNVNVTGELVLSPVCGDQFDLAIALTAEWANEWEDGGRLGGLATRYPDADRREILVEIAKYLIENYDAAMFRESVPRGEFWGEIRNILKASGINDKDRALVQHFYRDAVALIEIVPSCTQVKRHRVFNT